MSIPCFFRSSHHPAHIGLLNKHTNLGYSLISVVNTLFKNDDSRKNFFKNDWKKYNQDEMDFFGNFYSFTLLLHLKGFESFDKCPKIKQYFTQFELSDVKTLLTASLVNLNASYSTPLNSTSMEKLLESFEDEYKVIKNTTSNPWKHQAQGFTQILSSPLKEYILSTISAENFLPAFTIYLNSLTQQQDSFFRSLAKNYQDTNLTEAYRANAYINTIINGTAKQWDIVWQGFLISPSEEASIRVKELLNHYEKYDSATRKVEATLIIEEWALKNKSNYFSQEINKIEKISDADDIIFEMHASVSIFLDVKNVQFFYKKINNEKNLRYPNFFKEEIAKSFNNNLDSNSIFFKFALQSQCLELNNDAYLGFTFTYCRTNIEQEKIQLFYKNILLKMLQNECTIEHSKELEDEFILENTIPVSLSKNTKSLKF